jgi:hypothetical protein
MKKKMQVILASVAFLFSITLFGQAPTPSSDGCFRTEIINSQPVDGGCTKYKFKVSYEGDCRHALSHYTVAIPCGNVSDLANSENWAQVVGKDPKTGLSGFKIDNIPGFGDNALRSFYVSFTLCVDNNTCAEQLKCWEPVVAYKAGTEIFYDTLDAKCSSLKASLKVQDASCYGSANGAAEVLIEEGTTPYTFEWSTGAASQSVTNLSPGTYSVKVTDATGASLVLEDTVSQPEAITITGNVVNASCNGIANGAIDITVGGGSGAYRYAWSNGIAEEDLLGLREGIYTVTVSDSSGCHAKKTFVVASVSKILLSSKNILPGCNQSNGAIDITATGGTEPYAFEWSNDATSEDLTLLAAGLYKVKVTDSLGCIAELVVNLRDNNTLRLTALVQPTSCIDDASGAVNLSVSGGTPPYTFVWSNGATTEDLAQLLAGLYKVTVTDANGCTVTTQVNVSKKTFQVASQVTNPLCFGDSTGSISLTPSGGTEPYNFEWSNGQTGSSVSGLPGGFYQVTVIDSTGCSKLLSYVVTKPTAIIASVSVSGSTCNGLGGSSINLFITGGKPPYTYEWSNGETTEDVDSLSEGEYWVKIKDANGCEIVKEVIVESSQSSWSCLINQPDSAATCGSLNNILQTSVAGATTYAWSVQSSDGGWKITAGTSTPQIQYTAGAENSSATFTLVITKDGCVQSCAYAMVTCVIDSTDGGNGGEGPGSGGENPGDGDNNESCDDCFSTSVVSSSSDGNCTTYEVTVSTNGNCRHDLSHWDIAIPCGQLSDYWNSEGWKMEIGKDPTTGLYGLKVDDISGFGKETASFKVKFTLCSSDSRCYDKLQNWMPVVAYKAGQCIGYDTLALEYPEQPVNVRAYPNPFSSTLSFTWSAPEDEHVTLDLIDRDGRKIQTVFSGRVEKGQSYKIDWHDAGLPDDMYIYRYIAGSKVVYGKLFKSQ